MAPPRSPLAQSMSALPMRSWPRGNRFETFAGLLYCSLASCPRTPFRNCAETCAVLAPARIPPAGSTGHGICVVTALVTRLVVTGQRPLCAFQMRPSRTASLATGCSRHLASSGLCSRHSSLEVLIRHGGELLVAAGFIAAKTHLGESWRGGVAPFDSTCPNTLGTTCALSARQQLPAPTLSTHLDFGVPQNVEDVLPLHRVLRPAVTTTAVSVDTDWIPLLGYRPAC